MDKIGPELAKRLSSAQDYDRFEVNIFLRAEAAQEAMDSASDSAPEATVDRIRRISEESQAGLLGYLEGEQARVSLMDDDTVVPQVEDVEALWINNSVKAHLSHDALKNVLERDDVVYVELVARASLSELFDESQDRAPRLKGVVEAPSQQSEALDGPVASPPTWSVTRVNAPLLWQKGFRGQGVVVAVIDSGVNYKHPDLANRMWQSANHPHHGWDFDANDDDPSDIDGHGTCCAGIVAGDGAKGKATGVAPGARIMAIRVGNSENSIWKGMQFAITEGAHVISMSLTWKKHKNPDYPAWRRVCETIIAAGRLHANSTGNQGNDLGNYPLPLNIGAPGNCPPPWLHPLQQPVGGLSSAISCGATDSGDNLANYSGRGPSDWSKAPFADYPYSNGVSPGLIKPDICAPGPGTESCSHTYTGGSGAAYTSFGGTSSATPHVAGCLSLLASACLEKGQPIVPARVMEAISNTAKTVVGQTKKKENHYGAGRIDVLAAYHYGATRGWW